LVLFSPSCPNYSLINKSVLVEIDLFKTATVDESSNTALPASLVKVIVQLDTGVFLKSMVDQARMVVLKAVASATSTNIPSSSPAIMKETNNTTDSLIINQSKTVHATPVKRDDSTLQQPTHGRESLKRPSTAEQERLQKARKSALRLNSVLHGRTLKGSVSSITLGSSGSSGNTVGVQQPDPSLHKVTSIRWDTSVQEPKFSPALRLTPNVNTSSIADWKKNKLESYKSFGRPHGGDFGSGPRNATFGEYGRPAFSGLWGRDGRLAAHPLPSMNAAVDSNGNLVGGSSDLNATFDNVVLPNSNFALASSGKKRGFDSSQYLTPIREGNVGFRSSAASAGAALLGRLSNPPLSTSSSNSESCPSLQCLQPGGPSETFLPRTATALESSLMKKWS
jgi:hypothetical protein